MGNIIILLFFDAPRIERSIETPGGFGSPSVTGGQSVNGGPEWVRIQKNMGFEIFIKIS